MKRIAILFFLLLPLLSVSQTELEECTEENEFLKNELQNAQAINDNKDRLLFIKEKEIETLKEIMIGYIFLIDSLNTELIKQEDTLPTVSNGAEESHETIRTKDNSNAHIFIRKHQISTILQSVCTRKVNVEVLGLYPMVAEIPDDSSEKLYLDDYLLKEGFDVVSSSRGNWMNGPRMVELILTKADCECRIIKKYWSVESDSSAYTITEQLICNDRKKEINFYYPE